MNHYAAVNKAGSVLEVVRAETKDEGRKYLEQSMLDRMDIDPYRQEWLRDGQLIMDIERQNQVLNTERMMAELVDHKLIAAGQKVAEMINWELSYAQCPMTEDLRELVEEISSASHKIEFILETIKQRAIRI